MHKNDLFRVLIYTITIIIIVIIFIYPLRNKFSKNERYYNELFIENFII